MNLLKIQMDALNNCLKCSICVDSCPVVKVNPRFPGPKQLGIDWLRIAQEDGSQISTEVAYCSNCKTCETVCPSGVLVGTLNQLAKSNLPRSGLGLREIIFSDPARLGQLVQIWPQAVNIATGLPPVKYMMEKSLGISAKATMPPYSPNTLRTLLRKAKEPALEKNNEVIYFPGCFAQYNKPEIGMSLLEILTKLNYRVIVPDFQCCGQPSISNSRLNDTRRLAEYNLDLLKQMHRKDMPILFSCPSCLLTFKEEYTNILGMEECSQFNSSLMDAGQFLAHHFEELISLMPQEPKSEKRMVYHEPCHLRASGQGTPGLSLLNRLAGCNISPLEAGCCGLAGSYGLKAEKQWVSSEIGNQVKAAIERLKARSVVTECGMCAVQINNLTKLPVYHPLEIIAGLLAD